MILLKDVIKIISHCQMKKTNTIYTPPSQPINRFQKSSMFNEKQLNQKQSPKIGFIWAPNDESNTIQSKQHKYRAINASMIRPDKNISCSMSLNKQKNHENFQPLLLNKLARKVEITNGEQINFNTQNNDKNQISNEINNSIIENEDKLLRIPKLSIQSSFIDKKQFKNNKINSQTINRNIINSPLKFQSCKIDQLTKNGKNKNDTKINQNYIYRKNQNSTNNILNLYPKPQQRDTYTQRTIKDNNIEYKLNLQGSMINNMKNSNKINTIQDSNERNVTMIDNQNENSISFKTKQRMLDCESTYSSSIGTYKRQDKQHFQLNNDKIKDSIEIKEANMKKNKLKWPLSASPLQEKMTVLINKNLQKQTSNNYKIKKPIDYLMTSLKKSTKIKQKLAIESFELVEKIGKGAYGDVWTARHKKTGFICVIKKILKRKIKQYKLELPILNEIKIQSYINHKHLTSLYGFFHDKQYIYLIMQMLPDSSIKKIKKIQQKNVIFLIKQICDGLKYMHMQHIIHRDLKPENIFANNNYLKIGDFGCATYCNTGTRDTLVGCIAYISPQQLQNQSYTDKIDVWSVGILTYELLIGKSPFQSDIIEIIKKEKEPVLSQLVFPPDIQISQQAKQFIRIMLAKNPEERMNIKDAMRHPFLLKYSNQNQWKQLKLF